MGGSMVAGADKEPGYDKYEAESDLRHLTEAKKIGKDPRRMKHAQRAAKDKLTEMEHMKAIAEGAKP